MSRAVLTLQVIDSSQATIGSDDFPSGAIVTLPDEIADDLVGRGLCAELTTGGTGTILSGTASISQAHGLGRVPTSIDVTGQHTETAACVVTGATSTVFLVTAAGNTTANRSFYWSVR